MKSKLFTGKILFAAAAFSLLVSVAQAGAQSLNDEIEIVRGSVRADRRVVIAEGMNFTDQESAAFWPVYREYRSAMDKVNDGRVELVLEYTDLYPNLSDEQAAAMLKKYAALEDKAVDVRHKYLKKFSKILPAAKVLRFAQLEKRLDLAVDTQIASRIPLAPIDNK